MIKYTILYKNGKTWSGKCGRVGANRVIDCTLLVAQYKVGIDTQSVFQAVYVPKNIGGKSAYWEIINGWREVNTIVPKTPNPKSKTKKQKKFDKDYAEWRSLTKSQELKRSGFVYEDDVSIKAYKKWLYEKKQEKCLSEVAGALPGYKVALYTNADKQDKDVSVTAGDWIPWNGGEMPVPKGTMIHVKHRDGAEAVCTAGFYDDEDGYKRLSGDDINAFDWGHSYNSPGDIVACKLYEEETSQDAPQKIDFPSGATISWHGVYKPWKESAIEKFHKQVEEIQQCMAEAEGIPVGKLTVLCTENTWKELGWGNRTKPIKTTYTFWLGAFGELVEDKGEIND